MPEKPLDTAAGSGPRHPSGHASGHVPGMRTAVVVTAVLALSGGVLGAVTEGSGAAAGAVTGAAVVGAFYLFGLLSTSVVAAYAPAASLLVALLTYTLQVVVLGLLYVGLARSDLKTAELDRRWLGIVVIAGTLIWTASLLVAATRARELLYHDTANPGKMPRVDDGEPDTHG